MGSPTVERVGPKGGGEPSIVGNKGSIPMDIPFSCPSQGKVAIVGERGIAASVGEKALSADLFSESQVGLVPGVVLIGSGTTSPEARGTE